MHNAAPTGFRATVGAEIPSGVALVAVPATIAEIIPQTKDLETTMVEGQVLLVEPQGKTVVAVIALELYSTEQFPVFPDKPPGMHWLNYFRMRVAAGESIAIYDQS